MRRKGDFLRPLVVVVGLALMVAMLSPLSAGARGRHAKSRTYKLSGGVGGTMVFRLKGPNHKKSKKVIINPASYKMTCADGTVMTSQSSSVTLVGKRTSKTFTAKATFHNAFSATGTWTKKHVHGVLVYQRPADEGPGQTATTCQASFNGTRIR